MNGLPLGWVRASVGDVADISSGFGFPERFQGKTIGDFPFAKVRDISYAYRNNRGRLAGADNYVTHTDLLDLKARPVLAGSVAFAKIGEALRLNRRVLLEVDTILDNNCMAVTGDPRAIEAEFLYQFMTTVDLSPFAVATTVPSVRRGDVEGIGLPLPPLPEQRRIAAKIDSLTRKSRRARDQLDHIPRLVEKYKQAVLAAVFARGGGEPVRLGELTLPTAPIRYGVLQPGSVKDVGVPMIRVCDLQGGKIIWPDVRRIASAIDQKFSNARVQDGDVLLTVVGTIGRVAVVSGMHEPTNIARAVARIRPNPEKVLSSWLGWRLANADCQRTFALDAREVARKTLNVSLVKALSFPMPSLSVQTKTARTIETAFAWIDRLAAETTNARRLIDHLDQSVLAKAFRGELVPQDPADEPASVLLERIRAGRDTAQRTRRGRKGS